MSVRKTFCILCACCIFWLAGTATSADSEVEYLAEAIAALDAAPFVVRVAYGEMLLNRVDSALFPDTIPAVLYSLYGDRIPRKTPTPSDRRAAMTASRRLHFAEGALFMRKWKEVENTPLQMRSGVRLYEYFFYI